MEQTGELDGVGVAVTEGNAEDDGDMLAVELAVGEAEGVGVTDGKEDDDMDADGERLADGRRTHRNLREDVLHRRTVQFGNRLHTDRMNDLLLGTQVIGQPPCASTGAAKSMRYTENMRTVVKVAKLNMVGVDCISVQEAV